MNLLFLFLFHKWRNLGSKNVGSWPQVPLLEVAEKEGVWRQSNLLCSRCFFLSCSIAFTNLMPSGRDMIWACFVSPQHWDPASAEEIREGSLVEVMPAPILKKLARQRGNMYGWWPRREHHVKDKKGGEFDAFRNPSNKGPSLWQTPLSVKRCLSNAIYFISWPDDSSSSRRGQGQEAGKDWDYGDSWLSDSPWSEFLQFHTLYPAFSFPPV